MFNVVVHKVPTEYNRRKYYQSKHNYIKTLRDCVSKRATCHDLRLVILKLTTILHEHALRKTTYKKKFHCKL